MPARELRAEELCRHCDPSQFSFKTTAELEALNEILGQPRAVEAIRFGMEIEGDGYNVFLMGPPGAGKRTLVEQFLAQRARKEPTPDDWCYVNNFDDPEKPRVVRLPPGRGPDFQEDMEQFVDEVRRAVPKAFEADEYRQRCEAVDENSFSEPNSLLDGLQGRAQEAGLKLSWKDAGIVFTPTLQGEPMSPKQVEQLSDEKRDDLQRTVAGFQEEIISIMQKAPGLQRAARQHRKDLNRDVARQAIEPLLAELQHKYRDVPDVLSYLESMKSDLLNHADSLMTESIDGERSAIGDKKSVASSRLTESALIRGYGVNVIVSNKPGAGAPVIIEQHPTHENLIGRIEHVAHMGTLITNFSLVRAGSLLRANGGYLIISVEKILMNPHAWDALKRALRAREVRIEPPTQAPGLVSTVSLEPQPVPLKVKVLLLGSRMMYYTLSDNDPDFIDIVKVPADLASDMVRSGNEQNYARLVGSIAKDCKLRPFNARAVARVVEQGARLTGDAQRLTIHMRDVLDLLRESDYWAKQSNHDVIDRTDVQRAIDAQARRSGRRQEEMREMSTREILLIDVEGERIGQVNGIAVYPFGDIYFGHPSRITARVHFGDGDVLDIEREVDLGGALHSKGVLILQGYIAGRYATEKPMSLSASLVFEQSYGPVGGDSASSAELYALLSAISELPIQQGLAVTGSVSQHGQVQAIGSVNEKIEGYFDICKAKGLTGQQGVLIPKSNVQQLMLCQEIVDAVREGQFHLYAVETIDEGMEILTGLPAGEMDEDGHYPEESVNGYVVARLARTARARRRYGPGAAASSGKGTPEPSDVPPEEVPRTT